MKSKHAPFATTTTIEAGNDQKGTGEDGSTQNTGQSKPGYGDKSDRSSLAA